MLRPERVLQTRSGCAVAGDDQGSDPTQPVMRHSVVSGALYSAEERTRMGFADEASAPIPVVVELNLTHPEGLARARNMLDELWASAIPDAPPPETVTDLYVRARLTVDQVQTLVSADLETPVKAERLIYRVWPDYRVHPLVDASAVTVKADAARRAFAAAGAGITWAVIDSGIDANHPHFRTFSTFTEENAHLHRDFTQPGKNHKDALTDGLGHGTHVAGIIAGGLPADRPLDEVNVVREVQNPDPDAPPLFESRAVGDPSQLAGMAPMAKLISLKVIDDQGQSLTSDVVRALAYVREELNQSNAKLMRVHGVNLSLGYEFDPNWDACGHSPICEEVNRLVRSGVVVVVAAGNTGFGVARAQQRSTRVGMSMTINDPGNAELAITVGSTHRDQPHRYGVSYFSSKGPTGDGRRKPDLIAPGERIVSAGAGANLTKAMAGGAAFAGGAVYVEDSGTSMAAPHVAGAIAAFLSIRREFIGSPEEIKKIFTSSATSLGRDPNFEGAGLLDLMRAIQSV